MGGGSGGQNNGTAVFFQRKRMEGEIMEKGPTMQHSPFFEPVAGVISEKESVGLR
jgi:hypothetical protein